jgi:N-acyl-D-amino-acid deacylase
VFGLKDRGCLREGAWADIAVFVPEKVREHSTFKDPHHYATGFAYVFVNGTIVVQNDKHTRLKPGQVIRRSSAGEGRKI